MPTTDFDPVAQLRLRYGNASARATSSESPGSFGFHGLPGWMIATWQDSAASTICPPCDAASLMLLTQATHSVKID